MKDPYKILGVTRDSTDAEIKKAYYALAKKYHPDSFADSPLHDLAEEKMKEINEAYDAITKERESGGSAYAYEYEDDEGTGGTYNAGGTYYQVRTLINGRRYREAVQILDAIPERSRSAEWQYLYGCALYGLGLYTEAVKYIETACYMEPGNAEYRAARDRIHGNASSFTRSTSSSGGCGNCDLCSTLLCADCLCECLGGDLIRCC